MTGFPFEYDPEQIAAINERHRMTVETMSRGIDSMVTHLSKDKEHLLAFKWLMSQNGVHENIKLAVRYEGIADWILRDKFGVCPHCGTDHDEMKISDEERERAAADVQASSHPPAADGEADEDDEDELTPEQVIETILLDSGILTSEWINKNIAKMPLHPPRAGLERDMMKLYNLDDLWQRKMSADQPGSEPSEGDVFLGFVCKGCGMQYQSIQDRMLRSVDECRGCFLKAGHG